MKMMVFKDSNSRTVSALNIYLQEERLYFSVVILTLICPLVFVLLILAPINYAKDSLTLLKWKLFSSYIHTVTTELVNWYGTYKRAPSHVVH